MSYNLKNRAVAVIALAFMFTLALNHASFAAEENAAAQAENTVSAPVPTDPVDVLIQPTASAADELLAAADNAADQVADKTQEAAEAVANAGDKAAEAVADATQKTADSVKSAADELQNMLADTPAATAAPADTAAAPTEAVAAPIADSANVAEQKSAETDLDFLDEQAPEDFLNSTDSVADVTAPANAETPAAVDAAAPASAETPAEGEIADLPNDLASEDFEELKGLDVALPEVEAPKSPLEKFGNAILSKVDNNLFNQMSHIEKEATLLQLEKKREELRTKVLEERQKSIAIIEATRRAKMQLEEERKKAEAERQARILEEERKLKEKEMELEKLRQGKVINDYMNEMLMMNQQWVEKSAK